VERKVFFRLPRFLNFGVEDAEDAGDAEGAEEAEDAAAPNPSEEPLAGEVSEAELAVLAPRKRCSCVGLASRNMYLTESIASSGFESDASSSPISRRALKRPVMSLSAAATSNLAKANRNCRGILMARLCICAVCCVLRAACCVQSMFCVTTCACHTSFVRPKSSRTGRKVRLSIRMLPGCGSALKRPSTKICEEERERGCKGQ